MAQRLVGGHCVRDGPSLKERVPERTEKSKLLPSMIISTLGKGTRMHQTN